MVDPSTLVALGGALASGGAVFGGVVAAVKRIGGLERSLQRHLEADERHQREVIDRLARIETKLGSKR